MVLDGLTWLYFGFIWFLDGYRIFCLFLNCFTWFNLVSDILDGF